MYTHEVVTNTKGLPFKVIIHKKSVIQIVRHWHQSVEIDFTIHGDGDYFVAGTTTHLSDGQFIIINSNEVHGVENIGPGNKRRALTLLIPIDFLKTIYPNFEQEYFLMENQNVRCMKKVKEELYAIYKAWTNKEDSNEVRRLEVLGHFYLLISEMFQHLTAKKTEFLYYHAQNNKEKVKKIISYLEKNYQENVTLDEVATEFGFSRGYIARLFKKEVGKGIVNYLQLIRLSYAYQQLVDSDKSIEYISANNGFSNTKSFEKIFKKVYGKTPYQYRKEKKVTN